MSTVATSSDSKLDNLTPLSHLIRSQASYATRHYRSNMISDLKPFSTEKTKSGDYMVCDMSESDASLGSESLSISDLLRLAKRTKTHVFKPKELHMLPHELVRNLFTNLREERLAVTDRVLNDSSDNKTPDAYVGKIYLEIGTSHLGAEFAFNRKINGPMSYSKVMKDRGLTLLILGVGNSDVMSNFEMLEQDVEKVVQMYQAGRIIQEAFTSLGFAPNKIGDDLQSVYEQSLSGLENFDVNGSELIISKEMWSEMSYPEMTPVYSDLWSCAKKELLKDIGGPSVKEKNDEMVSKYLSRVRSLELRDPKSCKRLPVPMAVVKEGVFTYDGLLQDSHPLGKLWTAILTGDCKKVEEKTYNECECMDMTSRDESVFRKTKRTSSWFKEVKRVKVNLSKTDLEALSSSGYKAKKFRKDVKPNTQKTIGFDICNDEMDYQDYDDFINSASISLHHDDNSERSYIYNDLYDLLVEGGFDDDNARDFFADFSSCPLGHALSFLSSLFSELNTNLRKPTPGNEWFKTTVPHYKAMLAIHNTGSNKHSFYTVLVKKEDIQVSDWMRCFRSWIDLGDYLALDISSTRRHDLSGNLSVFSKMMGQFASILDVFSSPIKVLPSSRGVKEFLYYVLVQLENSNQTSEVHQLPRYMYMKTRSSSLIKDAPLSVLKKFPDVIHSRLASYGITKMIKAFESMSSAINPPQESKVESEVVNDVTEYEPLEDDLSKDVEEAQDSTPDLISFISGDTLFNYEEALCLSYSGIYHNKDKAELKSSYLQIFRKLCGRELTMPEDKSKCLRGNDSSVPLSEYGDHQFSSEHLSNCALVGLEYLKKKGLTESDMMDRIRLALDSITYEELATFKASLDMKHLSGLTILDDIKLEGEIGLDKPGLTKSIRALEGVLYVLKSIDSKESRPYREFSKIFDLCLNHGGVITSLFKKNQIGGVREIYILTMCSRIVIRFTETVARVFSEELSNEYLTKGTEKISSTPLHYARVQAKRRATENVSTIADSVDCTNWSQLWVFPAMGRVMSVLTRSDEDISEACRLVFNLSTMKRHEMPSELMRTFHKRPDILSIDDSMNVLKAEFLGRSKERKLNTGDSPFILNETNMMQGIHHYTSTVIHSLHLLTMSNIMKTGLKKNKLITSVTITTKASSDDASLIVSACYDSRLTKEEKLSVRISLHFCSYMLKLSYPLMCARQSPEKSTNCVETHIEEFNSFWTYKNSVLSVPTKFSYACLNYQITESCKERQLTDHTLMMSYLENGGHIEPLRVIEIGMAINHYESVGLNTLGKKVWKSLSDRICDLSHPETWMYISSPRYIGPILGFDYTLSCHLEKSSRSRKVDYFIKDQMMGDFDQKCGLTIKSKLQVGSNSRWKKFSDRLRQDKTVEDVKSHIRSRPHILYTGATDRDDVEAVIYAKGLNPSAARAFSFDDSSAMHFTSSYLVTSACMSISVKSDTEWVRHKMSLPAYLKKVSECLDSENESAVTFTEFQLMIKSIISRYTGGVISTHRRRRMVVKMRLPKISLSHEVTILSAMKYIWFGVSNGYTTEQNYHVFREYQEKFNWLREDYSITRIKALHLLEEESSLDMSIYNVLSREMSSDRTVSVLHSGSKSSDLTSTLISVIENIQCRNKKLIRPDRIIMDSVEGVLQTMEQEIFRCVKIPSGVFETDEKNPVERILKEGANVILREPYAVRIKKILSRNSRRLHAITSLLHDPKMIKRERLDCAISASNGVLISYPLAQKEVDGKWVGPGRIRLDTATGQLELHVVDDVLQRVDIKKPQRITQYLKVLKYALDKLGITSTVKEHGEHLIGIKNKVPFYTTSQGAPVRSLPYRVNWLDKNFITTVTVQKDRLRLDISPDGPLTSKTSMHYYPQSNVTLSAEKLPLHKGFKLIFETSEGSKFLEKSNPTDLEVFVHLSLSQRLSRRNFSTRFMSRAITERLLQKERESEEDLMGGLDDYFDFYETVMTDFDISGALTESLTLVTSELDLANDDVIPDLGVVDVDDHQDIIEKLVQPEFPDVHYLNQRHSGDYYDLRVWDDVIDEINSTVEKWSKLVTGNYIIPTDPKDRSVAMLLKSLINLDIIPEPNDRLERSSILSRVAEEHAQSATSSPAEASASRTMTDTLSESSIRGVRWADVESDSDEDIRTV